MVLRSCEKLIVGEGHTSDSILMANQLSQVLGFLNLPDLDSGIIRAGEEPCLFDVTIGIETLVSLEAEHPTRVLVLVLLDLSSLQVVCANRWVLASNEEKSAEQMQSADCISGCCEALVHNAFLKVDASELTVPAACVQHVSLSVYK